MAPTTVSLEEGCAYIKTGVRKIQRILEGFPEPAVTPEEYIFLYTTTYNMFTQKPPNDCSQDLYDMYKATIADYNQQTLLPSLCNKHDEYLLRELVKSWSKHKLLVVWLSLLFRYLERCFIPRRSLLSLNDVGLSCFHDLVYQNIKTKATDAVIAVIRKEREGEQIDRALLKNVVDVYVENGMDKYEEDFESFMLKDVASYYSRKVSRWIQEDSFPDYMRKSEECLRNEMERVHHYFHQTTEPKLVEVVQNEFLVVVAKQLLDNEHSGFRAMLRDGKMDDLSRMYRLYNPIQQGLERVADVFKQHVTSEGNALIKQAHDAAATNQAASNQGKVLIRKVIELHDKYMEYVNECFENHTLFHKASKEAFEVFCNKSVAGSSIAELLATFCDYILKKEASENLSYEAIERTLDNVVELLAYISEKDLFAEFYRKKQAHRLLFNCSACYELERNMLTKLNELLGDQFSSRMEGMVNDMSLAKYSKNEFRKYLTNGKTEMRIDLNVKVLTTGFWPTYKTSDINLPSEMVKCIEVFKGFNEIKTKHRRLSWIYSLGTCQIVGNFDAKPIELTVSTYQAALLLLFNNTARLSYEEILEQLNLSHEDLFRLLHSLSCAKYKILNKEPVSRNISKTDTFEFNSKFNDRSRRIKVPFPLMDELNKVVEDVVKDRRYAIDAAIVRIMKSRKVLPSQELVSECVEHFSRMFTPDIKMIMKRIEI